MDRGWSRGTQHLLLLAAVCWSISEPSLGFAQLPPGPEPLADARQFGRTGRQSRTTPRPPSERTNSSTNPRNVKVTPLEEREPESTRGTSSSKVKKEALEGLPLDKLTPKSRQRAEEVLSEIGYFRRLPTTVFAVDPSVYQYFVQHPDVSVGIWRAMEISELKMWQTGPEEYEGDAGDGTVGIIDVLYRGVDKNLVICEGEYKSPVLRKSIKAKSLILLETSFFKEADGTIYATHRADLFISFPSQTIETAARLLSPLTGPMVDRNFSEMSMFLRMMSMAMSRRPGWVEQIVNKMEGVPELRKTQLLKLTAQVYTAEKKRLEENPEAASIGPSLQDVPTTESSSLDTYPTGRATESASTATVPRMALSNEVLPPSK